LPQFKLVLYFHISDLQFKSVSNQKIRGYWVPLQVYIDQ